MSGFRRILVPLDGSAETERVLGYVGLLGQEDTEVVLLRATPAPAALVTSVGVPAPGIIDFAATSERMCGDAASYLEEVKARLDGRGLNITTVAACGQADEVITGCAREMRVDLILMSTHARGGLDRVVHGSVADAVVQHASCPVFLMPLRQGAPDHRKHRGTSGWSIR